MDFRHDDVASIAARVRAGEQTARQVVEHALGRIDALNGTINAFVAVDADGAVAQAEALDARVAAGDDPGPLAGVPVGVKDLEAVRGFVTSFGSAMHARDPAAAADSVHVARLRAAGAVIIGKTNTPEYGHKGATDNVVFGATRNPWSLDHSPGGSSGGTAAAVAAGMVPLGTGSDGGGSIRIPAALCGLTGLKPQTGRVPIPGRTMPGSGLLSCNGPMGRTAMDTAVALDAVCGPDGRDPLSLPRPAESFVARVATASPPERVVWCPTMGFGTVDREVLASCRAAVDALAAAGTEIVELDEIWPEDPVADWLVLWFVCRAKAQGHLAGTDDWDRLSDTIRPQIEAGLQRTGVDYASAQDAVYARNWQLEDAFEHAPYVLCPTTAGRVPRLGHDGTIDGVEQPGWVQYTMGVNLTRNPAGSVCTGLDSDGLPIGLQVIGRHHDDPGVLAVLAAVETVVDFDAVAPV